jgi:hypothetical protein
MRLLPPARATIALALVAVLALGACSDDESSSPTSTTPTPTSAAPTSAVPTTATSSPTSSATSAPTSSTASTSTTIAYDPGEVCTLGTNPDCIDPNDTGEGVYLIGGAACMAAARDNATSTAICIDLDRDGRAGYPDRG